LNRNKAMKFRYLAFFVFLLGVSSAHAEEAGELSINSALADFDSILDSIGEAVPERVTTGRIESIDLASRTAIIGGYLYHFGPSTDSLPLQVKLLGRDFGSLQMLSPGMDVEVYYFQSPAGDRVGNELVQIEAADVN
jgi:hypothetical protein